MSSEYVYENIRKYLKKNKTINDSTLIDYVVRRMDEEDLYGYIFDISTIEGDSSYYDPNNYELCINSDEIFYENADNNIPDLRYLISKKDREENYTKNKNAKNVYNLFNINHEINHIIQRKIKNSENQSLLKELLIQDQLNMFIDDKFLKEKYYKKYHDRFFCEYNANIESYIETISLLKAYDLRSLKDVLIHTNKIASKHILYLYSDIFNNKKKNEPLKNSLELYKKILKNCKKEKINIKFNYDVDIENKEKPKSEFEKLLLGFPINNSTYNYLEKVSDGKIKTLNLFDDIER